MAEVTREEFETRVGVLEREVEGEKMVTRHILEQTRRNGDDLAAIKTRLGRVEGRLDDIGDRMGGVEGRLDGVEKRLGGVEHEAGGVGRKLDSLVRDLPRMIGDVVREVFREERGKS
jgi:hypothetical protein